MVKGSATNKDCDSFMYRVQDGVGSLLLDDDNCACWSCFEIGAGMCKTGDSDMLGNEGPGVDDLMDDACDETSVTDATKSLDLYFRNTCKGED